MQTSRRWREDAPEGEEREKVREKRSAPDGIGKEWKMMENRTKE
jgi:hypothetical protein